jgi:murein L,D-transpeptidase YafK
MKIAALLTLSAIAVAGCYPGGGTRRIPHRPPVADRLAARHFTSGERVFIRIFKSENALELWLLDGARYRQFETYPICRWSGVLGPKLTEGDNQSPEGFYAVALGQMNPHSHYHRSFNVGFPNAYDRANGRTGSNLMVHGACDSAGCYAMTDAQAEEIFDLMEDAFAHGQRAIALDILPFRPTGALLAAHRNDISAPFWRTLAKGEGLFEESGRPPAVFACGRTYAFVDGPGCVRVREGG